MGYAEQDCMVRVDFFKPRGKWYCTEAVKWHKYQGPIHDSFADALRRHLIKKDGHCRLSEMTAVCLEPYHEYAHPLMMPVSDILKKDEDHEKPVWAGIGDSRKRGQH